MIKELILWFPTIFYTIAYFGLILEYIKKGNLYITLNLIGAIFGTYVAYITNVIPSLIISLVWIFISLFSYFKINEKITFISYKLFYISLILTFILSILFVKNGNIILESLGYTSLIIFVFSYYLFLSHKMEEKEYHIWNLIGSIFILSYYHNSIYIMGVYLFWGSCALYGVWSSRRKININ